MKNRIIALVGPTASGKTAAGVELALTMGGRILSADSMAVYRNMDIGTAKPTEAERKGVVFYGIDVADPKSDFSVGDFQKIAHRAIDETLAEGENIFVVGGSGLYVRAAVDGINDTIPAGDESVRAEYGEYLAERGAESLHKLLEEIDPETAAAVHANNTKRVIRMLEICRLTGRRASEIFAEDRARGPKYEAEFFGLYMTPEVLYERIERRVDMMMETGLAEEVERLLADGVKPGCTAMMGLGYKETADYILGKCSLEEAVAGIKINTRHFAKRQYTWFRADNRIRWINVDVMDCTVLSERIRSIINGLNR
ncbi:MAG: tRNA (adenosine(37)-N6)-dimethylallyltransferase MiaA [Abditibacteriota bacterium]|nr:tRNA (adenosine(37)-N6)-dimethylallyltransferase MiaA [Abditibacteriota bacterium]MBP5093296.1 tRNA (adenosine(37)-N6)-dimethylallyltransferase MiaA [Abditibacteriota bacterium]